VLAFLDGTEQILFFFLIFFPTGFSSIPYHPFSHVRKNHYHRYYAKVKSVWRLGDYSSTKKEAAAYKTFLPEFKLPPLPLHKIDDIFNHFVFEENNIRF
jgi:hypothetical protein